MKTVVVSGGASGIGLATAKRFVQAGYRVFILDKQAPIDKMDSVIFLACDLTHSNAIPQVVNKIAEQTQQVDALVCNAGMHFSANLQQTSEADYQRVMDINFKASFFLTQAILPFMLSQQQGSIVYVGSDQTLIAKPDSAIYGASKAALGSLAKTTAIDYAAQGIRANLVAVGTVDTPLYRRAVERYCQQTGADINAVHQAEAEQQPLGRIATAEEISQLIYFLCSKDASFITGAIYPIDGGYTAR